MTKLFKLEARALSKVAKMVRSLFYCWYKPNVRFSLKGKLLRFI